MEAYFARSLGFALLALGLVVVLLSGAIPLGSSVDSTYLPTSRFEVTPTVRLVANCEARSPEERHLAVRQRRPHRLRPAPHHGRLLHLLPLHLDRADGVPAGVRRHLHLWRARPVLRHVRG